MPIKQSPKIQIQVLIIIINNTFVMISTDYKKLSKNNDYRLGKAMLQMNIRVRGRIIIQGMKFVIISKRMHICNYLKR